MPSSNRQPGIQRQRDDLMLIVGQVLETTKTVAGELSELSEEVRANAAAIIDVARGLKSVEEIAARLDTLVRDSSNPTNLVTAARTQQVEISSIRQVLTDLCESVQTVKSSLDGFQTHRVVKQKVDKKISSAVWMTVMGAAWIVTTAIALYAALSGK